MSKGMIFDYGGTLDTGGCHWGKQIWHAWQTVGVDVDEQLYREAYVYGERTLGKNPIVKPDFTFRQTLDEKLRLELEYIDNNRKDGGATAVSSRREEILDVLYAQTMSHTAHSREVLMRLKERMPLVLVSNFYGNLNTVLREFRLDGIFTHTVESAVVGIRKPDPRIFTLGVEALGLKPEEVTVVGDSIDKDILPARKAGCHTVWIKGEQWTDDAVEPSVADKTINDIVQLL